MSSYSVWASPAARENENAPPAVNSVHPVPIAPGVQESVALVLIPVQTMHGVDGEHPLARISGTSSATSRVFPWSLPIVRNMLSCEKGSNAPADSLKFCVGVVPKPTEFPHGPLVRTVS